jgi:hypothetical protein
LVGQAARYETPGDASAVSPHQRRLDRYGVAISGTAVRADPAQLAELVVRLLDQRLVGGTVAGAGCGVRVR